MRFNQATKAPIILDVGEQKLSVPKFTLRDQVAWAAEIDAGRADLATKGLSPLDRFHMLNGWDLIPTDLTDLARRANGSEGQYHICSTCLARATVVGGDGNAIGMEKAREILEANPAGLLWLTKQLADIGDNSTPPAAADAKANGEPPLTDSAKTV